MMTAQKLKEKNLPAKLSSLWYSLAGFLIGALVAFAPFYAHAIDDWDLADKTTLFPREFASIASYYSPIWLVGGVAGAALGLLTWWLVRHFKVEQNILN